eukprot:TRINITY_DN1140_c0_g3_i6.p1 TRINITY_DN1140_c0_g3~~TRINITY_DN1140_c0_g3_i6.p1  ORF type:complete len:900 (+),score=83.66 TRINITY_DN1140_c0_g3_i6:145-2844(+)
MPPHRPGMDTIQQGSKRSYQANSWKSMENTCRHHPWSFSAAGDVYDNPLEAGAGLCRTTRLQSGDKPLNGLVISDNGCGFADKQKLADAYDVGKSSGVGKEQNFGQGEKAGSLTLANTIMKLAELDDQSRGVVMLSRTMQQKESQKADIPLEVSSILRPVVRWTWEDGGWAIDQDDDDDLHLILSYSPYHTEVEVMKAFDTLGSRNCRTHLVLHDLRPEIEIQDSNRDVKLNDAPSGCWAAKRSLRELLSLLYPTGFELPEVQRTRFELLGTPVVPVDLGLKSSRWMSRVVELKPQDEVSNGKSKKVRNDTPFTLRVGFVQDRNHLRMASRGGGVDTQQFCEGPQNLLQGFTVIKGQRVGQMPVPSVPPRCGNIVGHFKSGIGALMIAHIPKGNADVRAAPSKQEFEREAHETLETLRTMAVRVCSILFEELNATPKRKSPEIDIYDIPEPGRPARTRAVQSQIGSQMNAPLAATEATRGAQRGNPKRRKRANALPSSHAVAQNQAAPASWDNDAIVRWYASLLPSWGELGNVVWTKQQGSWWPAVLRAHRRQPRPGYVWIMNLYKPTEFAEVRPNEITPYHIPQHSNRKEGLGIKPTDRKKFDAALETAEDLELVSCVCGQQGAGADGLIGCDQCGRWLHSGCVGPEAAEQDSYVCWRCTGQQIQEFHGGPEVQQSRIDFLVDAIQQLKDTRRGSGNAALHMCEVWLHELKTQLARNRSAPCSSAQRNEPAAQPPLPPSLQSIRAAQPQPPFPAPHNNSGRMTSASQMPDTEPLGESPTTAGSCSPAQTWMNQELDLKLTRSQATQMEKLRPKLQRAKVETQPGEAGSTEPDLRVSTFLQNINIPSTVTDLFVKEAVSWSDLCSLKVADLEDIGVESQAHQETIFRELEPYLEIKCLD